MAKRRKLQQERGQQQAPADAAPDPKAPPPGAACDVADASPPSSAAAPSPAAAAPPPDASTAPEGPKPKTLVMAIPRDTTTKDNVAAVTTPTGASGVPKSPAGLRSHNSGQSDLTSAAMPLEGAATVTALPADEPACAPAEISAEDAQDDLILPGTGVKLSKRMVHPSPCSPPPSPSAKASLLAPASVRPS
mmetsp:Transcript_3577/g.10277  ORF Transcript_3577/g.10277 Transcript_3577/m.10277 type:complete len:191 (-) Transcript_3577:785-1357(-)